MNILKGAGNKIVMSLIPWLILLVVGLVLKKFLIKGYGDLVKGLKGFLGLPTDKQEKVSAELQPVIKSFVGGKRELNPFNPEFMGGKAGHLLTVSYADSLARRLKDAFGWHILSPDYGEIDSVFNSLDSQLKVSWVATRFKALYPNEHPAGASWRGDLFEFMNFYIPYSKADEREIFSKIIKRVMSLPVVN